MTEIEAWYTHGMSLAKVSICGEKGCPGRRACRLCRRMVEAKRRAQGKVKLRASRAKKPEPVAVGSLGGAPDSTAMNLSQLQPGPVLPPRELSIFEKRDEVGSCKRCGVPTDQWYKRTLDQARVRLCMRCQRESEAEAVQ